MMYLFQQEREKERSEIKEIKNRERTIATK